MKKSKREIELERINDMNYKVLVKEHGKLAVDNFVNQIKELERKRWEKKINNLINNLKNAPSYRREMEGYVILHLEGLKK